MAASASRERARSYRSPKRQEQASRNRRQILVAASDQFRTLGYAGTTMSAIAASAGVSVPTIELVFGTKGALLKAVIDVAIVGDDEPVPVLERPWAAMAQATVTPSSFLSVIAETLAEAAQRSDALVLVAFEAARSDERLRPLVEQLKTQRAVTAGWIVDGLTARASLRPAVDRTQAIDTVWLLMDPAVFDRLTNDRGWTPKRYGDWFADSISQLLVGPS
jgi:AcrR family transcriptional regulator